ncbi:MAG: hypothetical protein HY075_09710 [Deltaproteobacteria bacterium]|nr:hypothetical protein [Deltaproteobacteria bacterium]
MKRLAKGKAPFVSCDEFPAEKTDNVVLEVFATGGKVVHRQSIFLPLTRYFDYVVENADRDSKKKRRYVGGARGEESQAAVTVALPESVARFDEKLKIRFFSVKGHRLLGEGSL